MKFPGFTAFRTGILIPVFALRSENSCGVGEFADLKVLGKWCLNSGMDVVQLLPVNDTGGDPSPYSALSAFALHPIFCRLEDVPELKSGQPESKKRISAEIRKLKSAHEGKARVDYHAVLKGKLAILRAIFESSREKIAADSSYKSWVDANSWVKEYAVFRTIKALHQDKSWKDWKAEFRDGSPALVEKIWVDETHADSNSFFAWVQYRLEAQFWEAASFLKKNGILLKGDIPIMMNEDSADVWVHGQNFISRLRAGAPPDMFSRLGQNWGFPIYDWDYLEAHNFDWWGRRLKQADKFYQAYRIDHVLGFFRIWAIHERQKSGLLGFFNPSVFLSREDLGAIGFDEGRIRWLAEPHVYGWKLREIFGMRSIEIIARCFNRLGDEDLFVFKPGIAGERDLDDLPLIDHEKDTLLEMFHDRALLAVDADRFSATWTFRDCERYRGLNDAEKHAFEDLVARKGVESELLWEQKGEKLLSFMLESVPMLACAEDLGVIPDCVPRVLGRLGILGLKIPRWAREWKKEGQPYILPEDYPFLSVCAPSVHDTSTLREWWEREQDRWGFWAALGFSGDCPEVYSPDVAKLIISRLLDAGSALCLFQIQDLFAIEEDYRVADIAMERVNVPGTIQDSNWSYRIPMSLETIEANAKFSEKLKLLFSHRNSRALPQKTD